MNKIPLSDLFDIKYGHSLDLNILEVCDKNTIGGINYVSRTEKNNGVSATVKPLLNVVPFSKGLITVAGSGNSVLETCIQPAPFYTGYHVFVLQEKKHITEVEKLFYCFCIKQNRYRYSYGRQANKTLGSILLPKEVPKEFKSIVVDNLIQIDNGSINDSEYELSTEHWKYFQYGGKDAIFNIKNGYYNKKPDQIEKGTIPFIGSSEFNNGVTGYYSLKEIENNNKDERSLFHNLDQKVFSGNCITVSNNGSVGNAFYQPNDFTCSHDVNVLYLVDRPWNKYIALFVCTLINLEKYRWSYGRKWRPSRMPDSKIKLPVTSKGRPDYDFMESYIKSLEYSSSI